jgi:16S rRNA (cytosine967-C5)-methyltransferase
VSASRPENNERDVRTLATQILVRVEIQKSYADVLIDRTLRSTSLCRRDSALLTEITYGTLRWRSNIDSSLRKLIQRPLESTDPFIRNLLRTTLYQILFLDRIPDYAAVNAAVDLAKAHCGEPAGRFVNAVLRSYLRQSANKQLQKPDIKTAALSKISEYWSHPEWLVKRWRDFPGTDELEALLQTNNEEAPLVLRVNALKTTREDLLELLSRQGIEAKATHWSPQGIVIRSSPRIDRLPGYPEGLFQVQGEASQLVSYLLDPHAGERLLDTCAAPGGKSTHLAELTQDRGAVIAADISESGLRKVEENAARLGLKSICTVSADATGTRSGSFDRILVDAPCSGLGTLRNHPEIKWSRNEADVKRLSRLQQTILARAVCNLKSGGILVYSTCTLIPDENENVIEMFLRNCKGFILEDAAEYLPGQAKDLAHNGYLAAWPHRHGTDGFFAARIRKVNA